MKRPRPRKPLFILSVVLLLCLTGAFVWLNNEVRQSRLNHQLIAAVEDSKVAAVRSLLAQGADPNTHEGATPPQSWVVRFLNSLRHRPSPVPDKGRPLLNVALSRSYRSSNNDKVAGELVNYGADVNSQDPLEAAGGQTALICGASAGDMNALRMLLDRGADVSRRDMIGETALSSALLMGNYGAAQLLLDHGAKASGKDAQEAPLLLGAVKMGRGGPAEVSIVRALILRAAKVNARDTDGSTALMWTSENDQVGVARVLLAHGADINLALSDGRTALMQAAGNGSVGIVHLLLAHGARTDVKNHNSDTAIRYAKMLTQWDSSPGARRRQAETERLLKQARAREQRNEARTHPHST